MSKEWAQWQAARRAGPAQGGGPAAAAGAPASPLVGALRAVQPGLEPQRDVALVLEGVVHVGRVGLDDLGVRGAGLGVGWGGGLGVG
jgi:hypothetical protein